MRKINIFHIFGLRTSSTVGPVRPSARHNPLTGYRAVPKLCIRPVGSARHDSFHFHVVLSRIGILGSRCSRLHRSWQASPDVASYTAPQLPRIWILSSHLYKGTSLLSRYSWDTRRERERVNPAQLVDNPLYLYKDDPLRVIESYSLHMQSVHVDTILQLLLRNKTCVVPLPETHSASRQNASQDPPAIDPPPTFQKPRRHLPGDETPQTACLLAICTYR
jgi:hypothetical protein